jgi:hypothetical protein
MVDLHLMKLICARSADQTASRDLVGLNSCRVIQQKEEEENGTRDSEGSLQYFDSKNKKTHIQVQIKGWNLRRQQNGNNLDLRHSTVLGC